MKKIVQNYYFIGFLWFALAVATIVQYVIIKGTFNNYLIFEGVFHHAIKQVSLYAQYPLEYLDKNHYGILFSFLIAPFAILPQKIGVSIWILTNTAFLFWAITQLPLKKTYKIGILLVASHDLYTALAMQQFNPSVIALLVGSFVFIHRGKDHWATLFIVIGTLTKLYGIVGLAFFFFSRNKIQFVIWGIFWSFVLFCLPMLYTSPTYVLEQYKEWFINLLEKNNENSVNEGYNLQNLSLLGFLERTQIYTNKLFVVLSGILLFSLPYLRISLYKNIAFRLSFLASTSLFLVLFSTGTENSTYIIGYVGIGIWYILSPSSIILKNTLLALAIIASLSPTDLIPKHIKWDYVIKYSLRAIPVTLIWLTLIWEMCFANYHQIQKNIQNEKDN